MTNLYDILGIKADANELEIKSAFRQLAQKLHPDKNPGKEEWAQNRMRTLIEAYRILSAPSSKKAYDQLYHQTYPNPEDEDPFVARLKKQMDLYSQITLMLHLAYDDRGTESLEIYERLSGNNVNFSHFLHLNEYLDLRFLMGEEKQRQGNYIGAFKDYHWAYTHPEADSIFGFFKDEIGERLIELFLGPLKLPTGKDYSLHLKKVLDLSNISHRIIGLAHRRVAEKYLEEKNLDMAQKYADLGLKYYPSMSCARLFKMIKKRENS